MPITYFNDNFPGYEVLGELAYCNARILKARCIANGKLVAIKHILVGASADNMKRFRRESDIMVSINHPNIVKIIDVALDSKYPFIVMELLEDGDLRSLLNQKKYLDFHTTCRLAFQMAGALKVIHSRGIVHRDIKPENIMCRKLPNNEIHFLLTDFGIAKLLEQSITKVGESMMTCDYASPEQFNNFNKITGSSDYYSLGVVLFECIAGEPPFSLAKSAGWAAFIQNVIKLPPPDLSTLSKRVLPKSLLKLVNELLSKNPETRLSDADTFKKFLKAAEQEDSFGFNLSKSAPAIQKATRVYRKPVKKQASNKTAFAIVRILIIAMVVLFALSKLDSIKKTILSYTSDTGSKKQEKDTAAKTAGILKHDSTNSSINILPAADPVNRKKPGPITKIPATNPVINNGDTLVRDLLATKIKCRIIDYCRISGKHLTDSLPNFFTRVVDRYYSAENISIDEIVNEKIVFQKRWPYSYINIDTNSVSLKKISPNEYEADYNIVILTKRNENDSWREFARNIYSIYDGALKIKSIYEVKK